MSASAIKAVLFDLDDTLWPIVPVIMRAEKALFDWLRIHAPKLASQFTVASLRERREELKLTDPRFGFDLRALRHAALTQAFICSAEDLNKVDHAMAVFDRERNKVDLFDDVRPVLTRLKEKIMLGSVSNGPADLEAIGLAHHFKISVAAHRFGRPKPDPEIFLAACRALEVAPSEAAYVGDDPVIDVEGAQKAGLQGIWLNRAGPEPSRVLPAHIRPNAICASLYEVEAWLARLSQRQ